MKMGVHERLLALSLLREAEGSLVTLRVVRDLQRELSFSDEELSRFGITQDGDQVRWTGSADRDFDLGDAARGVLLARFKRLDAAGSLTLAQLPLYERLLEEPPKKE